MKASIALLLISALISLNTNAEVKCLTIINSSMTQIVITDDQKIPISISDNDDALLITGNQSYTCRSSRSISIDGIPAITLSFDRIDHWCDATLFIDIDDDEHILVLDHTQVTEIPSDMLLASE